jgi:hypothetical protein
MCFKGFTLSAEGEENFVVQRFGIEWDVNGKRTDFCGVLRLTRAKLAEPHRWKYNEL